MAANFSVQISFEEYLPGVKDRLIVAKWLDLMQTRGCCLGEDEFFRPNRDFIISTEWIKGGGNQAHVDSMSERLLEPIRFDWIDKSNARQHEFINYQISRFSAKMHLSGGEKYKAFLKSKIAAGKQLCVANIDRLPMATYEKSIYLMSLERAWLQNIACDHLFDWYRKDTNRKIETTWKWFAKYEPRLTKELAEIKSLDQVIMLFDKRSIDKEKKELCLKKIQRKLSQLKYDYGIKIEKEALYVEISIKAKSILQGQATIKGVSMSKIVENLILEKYIWMHSPI